MASKDSPESKESQKPRGKSKKKVYIFIVIIALVGARVVMACRNKEKCQKAADDITKATGRKPVVKILDLADFDSIRDFAKEINQEESRLDVLINNAGAMMWSRQLTEQGFELTFGTNHLGQFLLTHLLLDLLKKSAPSRIVVVSSAVHACSGVVVNSAHPGAVNTEILRQVEEAMPGPIVSLLSFFREKGVFSKTPLQGAQTQICLAVSEELEGVTRKYFSDCSETEPWSHAKNEDDAQRLWTISEQMTGLKTQ